MKLDYKILWLDDKMDVILDGEYDNEIKNFLFEEGFNPIIITTKNEKEFFSYLDDSYDLIMTDYHLNEKEGTTRDGDTIIKEVREKSIFTEIMFYSAQGEVVDTVKLDRITFVDTRKIVGNDHYEKLTTRALDLIKLTIRKFQHIVSMRGMIMNETSSLDVEMQRLLNNIIELKGKEEIIPVIKEKYIQSNEQFSDEIKQIDDTDIILLKIGATHRWRAVMRNLEKSEHKAIFNDYEKEIISIRNQFAHAILHKDDKGRDFFKHGKSGLIFNEELCKKIRMDIIKHRNNFITTFQKINENK